MTVFNDSKQGKAIQGKADTDRNIMAISVINYIYYNYILLTFHISRQYSIQNIPTNILHHQDFGGVNNLL